MGKFLKMLDEKMFHFGVFMLKSNPVRSV